MSIATADNFKMTNPKPINEWERYSNGDGTYRDWANNTEVTNFFANSGMSSTWMANKFYWIAGNYSYYTGTGFQVIGASDNYQGAFTPSQEAPSNPGNKPIWGDVGRSDTDQTFVNFGNITVPAADTPGKLTYNGTAWSYLKGMKLNTSTVQAGNNIFEKAENYINHFNVTTNVGHGIRNTLNWSIAWRLPVTPGKKYTIKNWNSVRTELSFFGGAIPPSNSISNPTDYDSSVVDYIQAPKVDGAYSFICGAGVSWIAFTIKTSAESDDVFADLLFGEGSDVIPATEYINGIDGQEVASSVLVSDGKAYSPSDFLPSDYVPPVTTKPLKVTVNNTTPESSAQIEYEFNGNQVKYVLAAFRPVLADMSNVFDWRAFYLNGTLVHTQPDDAAPYRIWGTTIGAEHGFIKQRLTCTGHGKTTADKGSKWTNGTGNDYLIVNIPDANHIDVSLFSENTSHTVNTLTHVAGATNTATMTITATVSIQMYPVIQNHSVKFLLDGKVSDTIDGVYYAQSHISFIEYYEIMDKQSIMNWMFENIGFSGGQYGGESNFAVSIVYDFDDKMGCTITHQVTALKDITALQDIMFLQSFKLTASSSYPNLRFYAPKTLPKLWDGTSYDFRTPTLLPTSNMTSRLDFTPDVCLPNGILADRAIELLDGVGLAIGYLPVQDTSLNVRRVNATRKAFQLSEESKLYMSAIDSNAIATIPKGVSYSTICYKNYFTTGSERTGLYFVESGDSIYLYIDWHITTIDNIALPNELIGKDYVIFEKSDNVNILNKSAGGNLLISTDVSASPYAYAILRFDKTFDNQSSIPNSNNIFDNAFALARSLGYTVEEDVFNEAAASDLPLAYRMESDVILAPGIYKSGSIAAIDKKNGKIIDFANARAGQASYFDKDGLLKMAPANMPRLDYSRGAAWYLFEKGATNLVKYSNSLSQSPWSFAGVTVASNADTALDGTQTASVLTVSGSGSNNFTAYVLGNLGVGNFTASFYVKLGTKKSGYIYRIYDNTTHAAIVNYTDYTSQLVEGKFVRIQIPFAIAAGQENVSLLITSETAPVAGTFIVDGVQVENGSFATSLIQTNGAIGVRPADSSSLTSSLATGDTGSLFMIFYTNVGLTGLMKDTSNRQMVTNGSGAFGLQASGVYSSTVTGPKAISLWGGSDAKVVASGGKSPSIPYASGDFSGTALLLFGNDTKMLRVMALFSRKFTDSEAALLTQ